jgi:hypothetical protein
MAYKMYSLALKVDPSLADSLFNLGYLLYRMSATICFEDPDAEVSNRGDRSIENTQLNQGIQLMKKASEKGHLRAR